MTRRAEARLDGSPLILEQRPSDYPAAARRKRVRRVRGPAALPVVPTRPISHGARGCSI